jgi:hypothetical protein
MNTKPKTPSSARRSNAQRAEDVLLKIITVAESVLDSIHDISTAAPSDGAAGAEDGRPVPLLKAADSVAKLIKASSEAANLAVEGLRQMPASRIDDADDLHGEGDYPAHVAIEAIDQALKKVREAKQ